MSDSVNHPKHYTSDPSGIECIEITRHRNFNIGNAIKYLWRAGLKESSQLNNFEKQVQDLDKAIWYIQDEKKRLQAEKGKSMEQASSNFCNVCRTEGIFRSIPTNDLTCVEHDGREICLRCKTPIVIGQSWELNDYCQTSHLECVTKKVN